MNSISFMEETDSNPGGGDEGKGVVLRQRVLGNVAVLGLWLAVGTRRSHVVSSRAERTSTSGAPHVPLDHAL